MELWELVARERIRDSLALYNWAGDAGRIEEMVEAFAEDGELEVRGQEPLRGRASMSEFLRGVARPDAGGSPAPAAPAPSVKRIVRHNLTNVRFLEVTPDHARVASYFTVVTEVGLDHYGRYRDTFVPADGVWHIKHRLITTDWASADSTMARTSPAT